MVQLHAICRSSPLRASRAPFGHRSTLRHLPFLAVQRSISKIRPFAVNLVGVFFDDKMAVVNASLRGEERGIALPLLLDLARKPVFLHDNSVSSLDSLLDPERGAKAPHPFFLSKSKDRKEVVEFLRSLDTNNSLNK